MVEQKFLFSFAQKLNESFFDICPKDLKWVNSKKTSINEKICFWKLMLQQNVMEQELKSCTGVLLRADLTGHSHPSPFCHKGGFQLEFVSISRLLSHMTCYKFECLIGGKFISSKKSITRWKILFSNFSCMFLNPNNFFQFEL